ncbi:MAG TPA: hypothetical protein VG076_11830 [Acidimicrobiales bacterium]|nr:hypothetical protein [Acidimicrobiales bacterium]
MRDRALLLRMLGIFTLVGFLVVVFVGIPVVVGVVLGYPIRLEFFVALFFFLAGIAVIFLVGRRRPPGTPLTWGEAMIGATFVFGVLLLAYGVVPNEWMKWADNQLLWRSDRIWFAVSTKWPVIFTGSNAAVEAAAGRGRIIVSFQALRDIIVATMYIVFLALQVALWISYQKRGRKPVTTEVARTSTFGRPVVKRA